MAEKNRSQSWRKVAPRVYLNDIFVGGLAWSEINGRKGPCRDFATGTQDVVLKNLSTR